MNNKLQDLQTEIQDLTIAKSALKIEVGLRKDLAYLKKDMAELDPNSLYNFKITIENVLKSVWTCFYLVFGKVFDWLDKHLLAKLRITPFRNVYNVFLCFPFV